MKKYSKLLGIMTLLTSIKLIVSELTILIPKNTKNLSFKLTDFFNENELSNQNNNAIRVNFVIPENNKRTLKDLKLISNHTFRIFNYIPSPVTNNTVIEIENSDFLSPDSENSKHIFIAIFFYPPFGNINDDNELLLCSLLENEKTKLNYTRYSDITDIALWLLILTIVAPCLLFIAIMFMCCKYICLWGREDHYHRAPLLIHPQTSSSNFNA